MDRGRWSLPAFGASLAGIMLLSNLASAHYADPFPPLMVSLSSPVSRLSDFIGIAMGLRKLTADIAWTQAIIYYGTEQEGTELAENEGKGLLYPQLFDYCTRVVQIDPTFKHVYYYGAAALGWNLNRLDEAEQLLKLGIQAYPKEWRFQQFLAGLAFQKSHDLNKLTEFLEAFVNEADCPNLLRSILANIYKKQRRYDDAIRIWAIVFKTQDPLYIQRADSQIRELYPLARASSHK